MTTKKHSITVKRVPENGDYLLYKDGKTVAMIFRTGFGAGNEWTCLDFYNNQSTGHATKRSAVEQIRFNHSEA